MEGKFGTFNKYFSFDKASGADRISRPMKNFLKEVLKRVAVNLVSFLILFVFGLFITLLVLSSLKDQEKVTPQGAFLVIDLSMNLTDRPKEFNPAELLSEISGVAGTESHHLLEVLDAIRNATEDDRIKGIFLHGSFQPQGYGCGYAALAELNEELARFRESGKPIVAHASSPSIRDYFVLSQADELLLHPFGDVMLHGFASETTFLGNAFKKYGVGVQLVRTGKFKGAAEPLISDHFSDENKEQIQNILDQRWSDVLAAISKHRNIDPDELKALLDDHKKFRFSSEEAVAEGLVDRAAYKDEAIERIVELGRRNDETGSFVQVNLNDYLAEMRREKTEFEDMDEEGGVAIVYVEGAINQNRSNLSDAGANEITRRLRSIRTKGKADAVVLRVNSPGGGVTASESIQREIAQLRKAGIPIVVSMGSVAASGGYWISAQSDRIFAQPETITGSIGVFGLSVNFKELGENFGVNWETVKTSPHADVFSIARPKTKEELSLIQEVVDDLYEKFLVKVVIGRGLPAQGVADLAQGRVWTGRDAKEQGLVDEYGGLRDAIDHAAELAELGTDYKITEYPRKRGGMELLRELLTPASKMKSAPEAPAKAMLGQLHQELQSWGRLNDPRGMYAILPWRLKLQ